MIREKCVNVLNKTSSLQNKMWFLKRVYVKIYPLIWFHNKKLFFFLPLLHFADGNWCALALMKKFRRNVCVDGFFCPKKRQRCKPTKQWCHCVSNEFGVLNWHIDYLFYCVQNQCCVVISFRSVVLHVNDSHLLI